MIDIDKVFEEFKNTSTGDKARMGRNLYMRIVNSISYGLRYRNTVLAESILLAFIYKLMEAGKGPTANQTICFGAVSEHVFDYECELYSMLHDHYEEDGKLMEDHVKITHNRYILDDMLYLSLILVEAKEEKIITPEERKLLELLRD